MASRRPTSDGEDAGRSWGPKVCCTPVSWARQGSSGQSRVSRTCTSEQNSRGGQAACLGASQLGPETPLTPRASWASALLSSGTGG